MIHESTSNLFRIIHYPPIAESDDASALRAAAHEDINLITVLIAGSEPGLQAQDLNGEWHNISCDKNTIVVNSGDMLKIASNNYVVTCHRNSKKCDPVGKSFDEDFPVYLVKYSRFGMVSKYKWSFKKNDWISR